MGHTYFPTRLADFLAWAQAFDAVYGADPARFAATPAEAADLHFLVQALADAKAVTDEADTRTSTTIAARNLCRIQLMAVLRPTCRLILDNLGISPDDKLSLGLSLPDRIPSAIAAPVTAPALAIVGARPLEHILRYNDENTPNRRAKPAGTFCLQLRCAIGDTVPADPAEAPVIAWVTRQPYLVRFTGADAKKTAHYWGRWQTRTGLVGPWSLEVATTIPAAG